MKIQKGEQIFEIVIEDKQVLLKQSNIHNSYTVLHGFITVMSLKVLREAFIEIMQAKK